MTNRRLAILQSKRLAVRFIANRCDEMSNRATRRFYAKVSSQPLDPLVDCLKAGVCPTAPCRTHNVVERLKTLTGRQRRVLALVAEGLPNKLIAYELGLCETTVKAHVSEILRKLCVYNRARAIALLADIDFRSVHLLLTRSPADDEAAQPTA